MTSLRSAPRNGFSSTIRFLRGRGSDGRFAHRWLRERLREQPIRRWTNPANELANPHLDDVRGVRRRVLHIPRHSRVFLSEVPLPLRSSAHRTAMPLARTVGALTRRIDYLKVDCCYFVKNYTAARDQA